MPILSNGSNVTLTVSAGQILTVQASDSSIFDFENPVGTRVGEYGADSVFGPFSSSGSVKLTSVTGPVYYELANKPVGSSVPFDPNNVSIGGGVIGGVVFPNAVGDGVSDDTAAIQAALTLSGRIQLAPGKNYKITSTLVCPANTSISAWGATISLSGSAGLLLRNSSLGGSGTRDTDISIFGGTWTRDSTASNTHLLAFHRADRLRIFPERVVTSQGKYSIYFADVNDFVARDIRIDSYSDGIHVSGPASRGLIENIRGTSGDDFVAVMGRDYAAYELTAGGGDVTSVTVRKINGTSVKQAVHLLAGAGVKLRNILVEDIQGITTSGHIVSIADDTLQANTTGNDVDGVTVRKVGGTPASGLQMVGIGGAGIGRIVVDSVDVINTTVACAGVYIGASFSGDAVIVRNINMASSLAHKGVEVIAGAVIGSLSVDGVVANLDPAGSNGRVLNLGEHPARVRLAGVRMLNGQNLVNSSKASALNITLSDISVKGVTNAYLIGAAGAHTVSASNISGESLVNGFFVLTAGSLDLRIENWRPVASAPLLFRSASQTARIVGITAAVDVTAVTGTAGDILLNTNAAHGAGAGVLISNGTLWKNLYTGAAA